MESNGSVRSLKGGGSVNANSLNISQGSNVSTKSSSQPKISEMLLPRDNEYKRDGDQASMPVFTSVSTMQITPASSQANSPVVSPQKLLINKEAELQGASMLIGVEMENLHILREMGNSIDGQAQGQIQDLMGGGSDCDRPKLPMVHSSVMRAKRALFSMGSGAHLRAPEALGDFITKYAFSPFWGTYLYYF